MLNIAEKFYLMMTQKLKPKRFPKEKSGALFLSTCYALPS